jgi:hypothetical protein
LNISFKAILNGQGHLACQNASNACENSV